MTRAALALLLTVAVAAPAAQAAQAAPHSDATDVPESGFDLTSVELSQSKDAKSMTIEMVTAKDWKVADLSPATGRQICVLFYPAKGITRVCGVPSGDADQPLKLRWSRIDAKGHPFGSKDVANAVVTHPGGRTLAATFTVNAAFLKPGRLRWRAFSGWVDTQPKCAPGSANQCKDFVPDNGTVPLTLKAPDPGLPIGCTAAGATERRSGPAGQKKIALTFDDGPGDITEQLLNLLDQYHAHATFFMVGQNVAGRAALLQRELKEGHMLANHSWNHANLSGGGATGNLAQTNAAIRSATGFTPCLFRPPYGATSNALRSDVASLHMNSILWSVDPNDWQTPGTQAIIDRVLGGARPGSIVLSHDAGGPRGQTLEAYRTIIPTLIQRGYKLVTVTELLGLKLKYKQPV